MSSNKHPCEDLSLEANASRSRLLRTIEELDRRGHDALNVRLQLHRHARAITLMVAALVIATSGVAMVAVEVLRVVNRWRRRRRWA